MEGADKSTELWRHLVSNETIFLLNEFASNLIDVDRKKFLFAWFLDTEEKIKNIKYFGFYTEIPKCKIPTSIYANKPIVKTNFGHLKSSYVANHSTWSTKKSWFPITEKCLFRIFWRKFCGLRHFNHQIKISNIFLTNKIQNRKMRLKLKQVTSFACGLHLCCLSTVFNSGRRLQWWLDSRWTSQILFSKVGR